MDAPQEEETFETSDEEDEIEASETFQHEIDGGYVFITNLFCFEDEESDVMDIQGHIKHGSKTIGSLQGWLLRRSSRMNFYSSCDSVSAELQLLSNVLFHQTGRLNKALWRKVFNHAIIVQASSGGFLNIDSINIEAKDHRGKDLSHKYLQFLLADLRGKWSISVIVPGLTNHDLDLKGDVRKLKEDYVCQLFARSGYKFLEIESSDPYWYLLPNDIKNLNKPDVKNVKFMFSSNDNWSEYKKSISNIHSNSCFEEALVDGYEEYRLKPDSVAKAIDKYRECIVQMPLEIKNLLIEGVLSPRMFDQLLASAQINADTAGDHLYDLPKRQLILPDEVFLFPLLEYIPENITEQGVYKSFFIGFTKVLQAISMIMSCKTKKLPTVTRVMDQLCSTWPPSHKSFFEKGGRIVHLLRAIIESAKSSSWAYGDGMYDEINSDGEEELPIIEYFDHDFHFVETVFLKHLLGN